MLERLLCLTLWVCFSAAPGWPADNGPLNDKAFQDRTRRLKSEPNAAERLRRAQVAFAGQRLTSLQVKHVATLLPDDQARLEFAVAVYPAVVDPENFYEVYDAFTAFSKVMRLHDHVRPLRRPPVVAPGPPPTVTPEELQEMLKSLRQEPFDDNRKKLARQIISASRHPFLTSQIKEFLRLFPFDDDKLEVAKLAYDRVLDADKYFQLNESFAFPGTRESLTRFLDSKGLGK